MYTLLMALWYPGCWHWRYYGILLYISSFVFLLSYRVCGQIQMLWCPHHSWLGETLVVFEEDLLSDCWTQLVWNPHYLHDSAQQWSLGKRICVLILICIDIHDMPPLVLVIISNIVVVSGSNSSGRNSSSSIGMEEEEFWKQCYSVF